jgi:hypothetical protein
MSTVGIGASILARTSHMASLVGAADVKSMFEHGLGIVMFIGFFVGTVLIISGAWQIKQGNADQGKLSIIGGIIIAAAPAIMTFFFGAGGMDDGEIEPSFG